MIWRCREHVFDLDERPLLMGVLNVTPDSFSDGGRWVEPDVAAQRALEMRDEGADIIDIGAESTRPGSDGVSPDEQWRRIAPVLERLQGKGMCVSIDTSDPGVAERSLGAGASIINDVRALADDATADAVARSKAGVVLMHMKGTPRTMQKDPHYDDVLVEVRDWLAERVQRARRAGVADEAIALDPGIGFGKRLEHNLELIAQGADALAPLGRPVLIGLSRKSFMQHLLGLGVDERLEAGLAATAIAVFRGAHVVRTHDVRATHRALGMADALRGAQDRARMRA